MIVFFSMDVNFDINSTIEMILHFKLNTFNFISVVLDEFVFTYPHSAQIQQQLQYGLDAF